jgi:hypothetical protein
MPINHDKILNISDEEDSKISGAFPEEAGGSTNSYIRHVSAHCCTLSKYPRKPPWSFPSIKTGTSVFFYIFEIVIGCQTYPRNSPT